MKDGSGERVVADSFRVAPGGEAGWLGIYYGWYTVLLTMLATMIVVGATNYAFSLFVKPVSAELGLSRASLNSGMILFQVGAAIFSPLVGRLLDRYPARLVVLGSGVLMGGGFVVIGTTSSVALMAFCILVPVAIGAIGAGGLFAAVAVARWFDRLRGRALVISAMGTSFGGLVVFPLVAVMIDRLGWRTALVVTGIAIWLTISAIALLLREPPRRAAHDPAKPARACDRAWTTRALFANREFWTITVAISLMLGVDGALLVTLTPYAQDRGFTLVQVTSLMTTATASALTGKIVIAWIADRADLRILVAITALMGVFQCSVLMTGPTFTLLLFVHTVAGLATGGTYAIYSAIVAERFGVVSYGWVRGLMMPFNAISSSASLYFVGAMYDWYGNYANAFAVMLGGGLAATLLILTLRKKDGAEPLNISPLSATLANEGL
jgi:MFS family permease